MIKEVRNNSEQIAPLREESRLIEGYAIVFDTESTGIAGFTEIIDRNALEDVISKSDVLCLLDHNLNRGVLARCNKGEGSLVLEIDDKGLKYTFEAPNTSLGDELLEGIRRGDISTSSFAFTVEKDTWSKRSDGSYLRTINKINQLFDVSPVYRAAYDSTSVKADVRGLDELKAKEKEELNNYYKELRNKLK